MIFLSSMYALHAKMDTRYKEEIYFKEANISIDDDMHGEIIVVTPHSKIIDSIYFEDNKSEQIGNANNPNDLMCSKEISNSSFANDKFSNIQLPFSSNLYGLYLFCETSRFPKSLKTMHLLSLLFQFEPQIINLSQSKFIPLKRLEGIVKLLYGLHNSGKIRISFDELNSFVKYSSNNFSLSFEYAIEKRLFV